MADVPDAVLAALAAAVARLMPVIAARIPPGPAAELGRLETQAWSVPAPEDDDGDPAESPALAALRELSPLQAERLLGALELTLGELELSGAPDLSPYLGGSEPQSQRFAFAYVGPESQTTTAVTLLERLRPGAAALAASLTGRLAGHPLVAPLLDVPSDVAGEAPIAAAHGAAYLALSVAAARAVVGDWRAPVAVDSPAAAVIGVGLGAAIGLLREVPKPAGYAAARLARAREEYLMPRAASGSVPVSGHRFALVEGEVPEAGDSGFSGNGVVAVVPGGAVIRTGLAEGLITVTLRILDGPPDEVDEGWDEVVEVSWTAAQGQASVVGPNGPGDDNLLRETPPWPGDYRLRVHALGRDDADEDDVADGEIYELAVWRAPAGPEIVYRRTDRLGHRLRGEPEPPRPDRPERAYRWVEDSSLRMAATVTVVTGSTAADVLSAFGADPDRPESLSAIAEEMIDTMSIDPWVAVLDAGSAVLAVEYNGWQGSDEDLLASASAGGRAASMFWNVEGLTRLSFAERGSCLASFEPPDEVDASAGGAAGAGVAQALAGLDFDDYRDKRGKGLIAVERFAGRGITADDLDRIEAADVAYRIVASS
ncbi:MAG TPA: DUF6461 domain-containing protein [Streptosporangiaceae bacterium]|nr:DUF6461 domain-containing protein [Streptosporangiaceae bacterium]